MNDAYIAKLLPALDEYYNVEEALHAASSSDDRATVVELTEQVLAYYENKTTTVQMVIARGDSALGIHRVLINSINRGFRDANASFVPLTPLDSPEKMRQQELFDTLVEY